MINLDWTEAQMLAEIGPDPAVAASVGAAWNATWPLVASTPDELMPTLASAFSSMYAHVAAAHVSYDLVAVVKKGLGNAYKWGNHRDPRKRLAVTSVLTRVGAVIKITDEGDGFDVSRVVTERLFTRKGSGLTRFRKTSSVISYADGGRTLLIRFLCDAGAGARHERQPPALASLRVGDQVKVKGLPRPDGNLLATKITIKPVEEFAVVEGPLQHGSDGGHMIRLLNLDVALTAETEILDAASMPADPEGLHAGQ